MQANRHNLFSCRVRAEDERRKMLVMGEEGLWRRGEEMGSGCLCPNDSSTGPLQWLTLFSEYSCSTLRRPWSLSQPPSFIADDAEALTDRSSLAADGSGYESGPEASQITPPEPRRSQTKLPRRVRPKTTWHPSTGHWKWTVAALRVSPARATGHARTCIVKKHDRRTRKRRATDAITSALRNDAQVRRISLLERELDLQRRIKEVCEAIDLARGKGDGSTLYVDEASPH